MDIDRMNQYTGRIDGKVPGQPYEKQWWMKYFDSTVRCRDSNNNVNGIVSFKKNRFTGAVYVFTRPEYGNRWNEPGYGWGAWVKL